MTQCLQFMHISLPRNTLITFTACIQIKHGYLYIKYSYPISTYRERVVDSVYQNVGITKNSVLWLPRFLTPNRKSIEQKDLSSPVPKRSTSFHLQMISKDVGDNVVAACLQNSYNINGEYCDKSLMRLQIAIRTKHPRNLKTISMHHHDVIPAQTSLLSIIG